MKIFNLTILLLFASLACIAQNPIDDFNLVIDAYSLEYTSTEDPNEQASIDKKYEKLIEEAEKKLEAALENEFQESMDVLQEEEDSYAIEEEIPIGFEEDEEEEPFNINDWISNNISSRSDLQALNKSNATEAKPVTLKMIAEGIGVPYERNKAALVESIWETLNN